MVRRVRVSSAKSVDVLYAWAIRERDKQKESA
jgi:hypothetical protein